MSELEDQDFQIWEIPTNEALYRPLRPVSASDAWTVERGEQILFQEFAMLKSQNVEGRSHCIVLFLVKKNFGDAHLVARNQIGSVSVDIGCTSILTELFALGPADIP